MPRLTPNAFYTTSELADFLKLKPRTIQRWIDEGQLKAYQFGRKYRIRGEDFDQFLETYKAKRAKDALSDN
jgi:excisionase family DNA binding protein